MRGEKGLHLYHIIYYFTGEITEGPKKREPVDMTSFNFEIDNIISYRKEEFPKPVLALECYPQVAWAIDEKEPKF